LIAISRKILRIIFAIVRENAVYLPDYERMRRCQLAA
jgi:hypothetical protein